MSVDCKFEVEFYSINEWSLCVQRFLKVIDNSVVTINPYRRLSVFSELVQYSVVLLFGQEVWNIKVT